MGPGVGTSMAAWSHSTTHRGSALLEDHRLHPRRLPAAALRNRRSDSREDADLRRLGVEGASDRLVYQTLLPSMPVERGSPGSRTSARQSYQLGGGQPPSSATKAGPPLQRGRRVGLCDALRYIALVHDRKEFPMHQRHPRHSPGSRREFARSRGYGPGRGRGGPRARRGDVRAAALALLAERPMHGYEMIKEIEERTEGAWTPSAGSIYPTLQLLEDEGLISGQEIEGKRRFTLTDSGRAEQESRSGEQTPWDAVRAGAAPEQFQLARLRPQAPATRSARSSMPATRTRSAGSASCSTRRDGGSTRSSPRRAEPGPAIMPPR